MSMTFRSAGAMAPPIPFVYGIDRPVMPNFSGIGNDLDLIVEDDNSVLEVDCQDSMPYLQVEVLNGDDAHIVWIEAEEFECHVFCDGIILAITEFG